jgi:hypothetical protein
MALSSLVTLCGVVTPAFAWGDEGHQIVGSIGVVADQLSKAGMRLAFVLNEALE